jgi:putative ABC transport system ATP-binding protein
VTQKPVIEVRDLIFAYPSNERVVLNIKNFSVGASQHVFLHGPSGSGKTTLLGILAGIIKAQTGSVRIMGHDFAALSTHERDVIRGDDMGYIFQMFNLIPYLSVLENILLPLHLSAARRSRLKEDPKAAALQLTTHLRIDHLLDRPVTSLSVGQQQRVAAARALIGNPRLVIADEPTSALDTDHREAFLQLLFAEAERVGSSVLFVSHDHTLKSLFQKAVSLTEINHAASPSLDS